jgi:phage tail sheath gpL-like
VRINGDNDLIAQVAVAVDDTAIAIATALYSEIVKLLDAPITVVDGGAGVLTFTAKNTGTFGNFISIEVLGTTPAGLTATVSAMSSGASDPDISTALAATGNNAENDTDLVHGYDIDGTVLSSISSYNGEGNTFEGMYQKEIGRPFRSMSGDVDKNYATITAFADARKTDRTNGVASLPGCTAHPQEIGASIMGVMARVNAASPAAIYEGEKLTWIPVAAASDRYWELGSDGGYEIRDAAVRKGVTPVIVIGGVYTLQNVSTFYHPDAVDEGENGWIDMSDISVTQNVLQYMRDLWGGSDWTGVLFVADTSKVGTVNPDGTALDRSKFKDRIEVITELIEAARAMEGYGWLFNSDYTIEQLQADSSAVVIRSNGTGFDYSWKLWYRLKGYIKDGSGYFNVGGSIAA